MSHFILTCEHEAGECYVLSQEIESLGAPAAIEGRSFFCSCPFGHHGGWVAVEGESPEAILDSLGPQFRSHAQLYEVELVRY